jgi:glycosyltransferase involved in cell wall biosynthesis
MHIGLVSLTDIDYGLDLANALFESGTTVSLYMSQKHTARAVGESTRLGERIYELGLLPSAVKLHLFNAPRMRDLRSLHIFLKLSQTIKRDGVEVAHLLVGSGDFWIAVLSALLRDMPVVATMREPIPNINDHPSPAFVKVTNKILALGSDVVIANGQNHVALIQATYAVPENRVSYVPLGPRTTAIRWTTSAVPEDPGMILFFGSIQPRKGLEYLVRAQPVINKHIPNAHIVIAGHGKEELERCRLLMQDSTRFEIHDEFIPNKVMAELFQKASLVVLPYISASTSGILMTAYVFGKPVVVTRVGSLPEYVEDGVTGFLISPADEEQLAQAIIRLLLDETMRHRMGEEAKRWAYEEQTKNAIQSLRIYEKAIHIHNNA